MNTRGICCALFLGLVTGILPGNAQDVVKKTSDINSQKVSTTLHTRSAGDYYTNGPQGNISAGWKGSVREEEETGIYLIPEWVSGKVILKDNTTLENLKLRYNIYHQQMQFISEGDTLAFSKPEELNCLFLGDKKFIFIDFDNKGSVEKGYFELRADGRCQLLLRRSITYHLIDESVSANGKDPYMRSCDFYIRKNNEIAKPIIPSKKTILNVLNDRQDTVREFINDNKLNMRNYDDFLLVINFYNNLK
jgi:hypothetical protein